MLSCKIFIIPIIVAAWSQASTDNGVNLKINFLFDFVQTMNDSNVHMLTVFTCWNRYENLRLIKLINSVEFQLNIFNINIDQLPILPDYKRYHNLFVADFDCANIENIVEKFEAEQLWLAPNRWILLGLNVKQQVETLNALTDSDVIIAEVDETFKLNQIYKINPTHDVIFEEYGQWDQLNGLVDTRTITVLAPRRMNFRGSVIKASFVITDNDTYDHLSDYKHKEIDTITKHPYLLVNYMIDTLNATREFIFTHTWGYQIPNSTLFTGMIGQLQNRVVDIAGSALIMTEDRMRVIEFVAPTTYVEGRFVFRQPPLSSVANVYMLPFTKQLWYALCLLVVCLTIVLYIIVKLEFRANANFGDVVLTTIGAICQQSSSIEPEHAPGRISIFVLFATVTFVYTSYSANIVALLQSSSDSINSLPALLHSPYTVAAEDMPYHYHFFKIEMEPVRRAIYEKKIIPPNEKPHYMNITEGVKGVRGGLFAFHGVTNGIYREIENTFYEHEKCDLQELHYVRIPDGIWVTIPKKSPYLEIFRIKFRKMHERGLQKRDYLRLFTVKPKCASGGSHFSSVGMNDIDAAFYISLAGVGVGVVLFLLELIHYRVIKYTKRAKERTRDMR